MRQTPYDAVDGVAKNGECSRSRRPLPRPVSQRGGPPRRTSRGRTSGSRPPPSRDPRSYLQAGVLRFGYPVDDPGIPWRLCDHLAALVGGYYPLEITGKVRRGLTVARRAVPGDLARRRPSPSRGTRKVRRGRWDGGGRSLRSPSVWPASTSRRRCSRSEPLVRGRETARSLPSESSASSARRRSA